MDDKSRREEAERIVTEFAAAVMVTTHRPIPLSSLIRAAVVKRMLADVSEAMGAPVSLLTVARSVGLIGTLKTASRVALFEALRPAFGCPSAVQNMVEVAGTALGVSRAAGRQAWILGHVAIAVAENGGAVLTRDQTVEVMRDARSSFEVRMPGAPIWASATHGARGRGATVSQ